MLLLCAQCLFVHPVIDRLCVWERRNAELAARSLTSAFFPAQSSRNAPTAGWVISRPLQTLHLMHVADSRVRSIPALPSREGTVPFPCKACLLLTAACPRTARARVGRASLGRPRLFIVG